MEDEIEYPNQIKKIDLANLSTDELIRRLKMLSVAFQEMTQDENAYTKYIPLALFLANDSFLENPSKDVQLLVACCIADILRVFAPDAPYKDQDQIKTIFMFLMKQLNGLKDPTDPAFKRYFYLLENLAYVKSFNMCFDLMDCQQVFCELFSLMFRIVKDEHSAKVKLFMTEILAPLISESDSISYELLDIIFVNIIEPQKTQKRSAYSLAKDLILKTSSSLVQYVQAFLNDAIITEKNDKKFASTLKLYDLIYELNAINSDLLVSVLPQLECKLKSVHEHERLKAVSLLARLFSEKDSKLAKHHNVLWNHFLGRFLDIAVAIRIKCVQSTMHFLLNHQKLRNDVILMLKSRQHDSDETVRYEVVTAIVETAKRDFKIVAESTDLMIVLKERSSDKKFKIRKVAMTGLAVVYQKYLNALKNCEKMSESTAESVSWIQNKILNGYYKTTLDDQLMVERLLTTHLIPYQLPNEDRMKVLYRLLATVDDNAMKAFIELQKNQMKIRKNVSDWLKMHKVEELTPDIQKEINKKCSNIIKLFPEPVKSQEYLLKFSQHMRKDPKLLKDMETVLKRNVECKECADSMTAILKKLGQPVMTNLYYNTIKMLLNRVASVMVDKNGVEVLIQLIEKQMNYIEHPRPKRRTNGVSQEDEDIDESTNLSKDEDEEEVKNVSLQDVDLLEDLKFTADEISERGLKLLTILIYLFPAHFQHLEILQAILSLLSFNHDFVAPNIFKAFTHLGKYKPIIESHIEIIETFAPYCKLFAIKGTPKQAKHAIRCLFVNAQCQVDDSEEKAHIKEVKTMIDGIFVEIVDSIGKVLTAEDENYRTAIVSLGHIAYNLPERFNIPMKNIVSRKIVKELLIKAVPDNRDETPDTDWCEEELLSEEIKCRIEGLKAMGRWLIGLKDNTMAAQKTFRMLTAFIKTHGDILSQGTLTNCEMSWLRVSAGKAMLKICEQKGVGDEFIAEQFFTLSTLMNDPVPEVRETFMKKLHKGLYKGIPHKCLPLDFMGFYALAGRETDRRLQAIVKNNYEIDVNHRREYVRTFSSGGVEYAHSQLSNILPDYILPFAVSVLAHSSFFSDPKNLDQLQRVEKCMWFILEPLINNKETFCFSLYTNLIDKMKAAKSAYLPNDENVNTKIYTICDLTSHLLLTKLKNIDMREYELKQVSIPAMYFLPPPSGSNIQNSVDYLSREYKQSLNNATTSAANDPKPDAPGPAPTLKREADGNRANVVAKRTRV